jgi:hypothetical protein
MLNQNLSDENQDAGRQYILPRGTFLPFHRFSHQAILTTAISDLFFERAEII